MTSDSPYFDRDGVTVWHGDCLDVLASLPDESVDAVVTDPPYALGYAGKEWDTGKSFVQRKAARANTFDHVGGNHNPVNSADAARTRRSENRKYGAWCEEWAAECYRILKPGGWFLAFGGTRTWHRLAAAVEDAGFEVRDNIAWVHSQGFPKSLDVAKALDATAGAERPIIGERVSAYGTNTATGERTSRAEGGAGLWGGSEATVVPLRSTEPVTDLAREWEGWGTALKPAFEPIVVGRKPLAGTVASNITVHGVGALNIDGCRVGPAGGFGGGGKGSSGFGTGYERGTGFVESTKGRWPPNVAFDENTARTLDAQTSDLARNTTDAKPTLYDETGGASKAFPVFRYEPKAPQSERPLVNGILHPTVKPLGLIRWLTRLVTPPGGVVLEPFAGSGTTVEACLLEGFQCVAIEREPDYLPLIAQRVARHRDPIEATRLAGDDLGLFASLYDEDTHAQPDTPPTLL